MLACSMSNLTEIIYKQILIQSTRAWPAIHILRATASNPTRRSRLNILMIARLLFLKMVMGSNGSFCCNKLTLSLVREQSNA